MAPARVLGALLFLFAACGSEDPLSPDAGTSPADGGEADSGPNDTGADAEPRDVPIFDSGGAPDAGDVITIAWSTCPQGTSKDPTVRCTTVEVPLDWDAPSARRVEVPIIHFPADSTPRNQIWLLSGGPGQGAVRGPYRYWLSQIPDAELYIPAFRGTEGATRFECPELQAVARWLEPSDGAAVSTCAASLEAIWGDGLSHFKTSDDARDIAEIARRVRRPTTERIIIVGVSYGTTRAQRLLQIAPDLPQAVVLDSLDWTDQIWTERLASYDDVGQSIFAECAADAACRSRLGADPWARVQRVFDALEGGTCTSSLGLDRAQIQRLASKMLEDPTYLGAALPALVHRLERCDAADQAAIRHLVTASRAFVKEGGPQFDINMAVFLQVLNADFSIGRGPTTAELRATMDASTFSIREADGLRAAYDRWPQLPIDPLNAGYPSPSVPMLMMVGALDARTTAADAQGLAARYNAPNQRLIVIPHYGHGAALSGCGLGILNQFLADPSAALDTSCLAAVPALDFAGTSTRARALFGTADFWD
jgi:pimeloyl-ACP methyl ester carboxylesterase